MLVLFINGRPVDCSPLKRALEATYAAILPKASKPWMFLVRRLLQCLLLLLTACTPCSCLCPSCAYTFTYTQTYIYTPIYSMAYPFVLY